MARALRITFPGAFYHVTSRGNERKAVFKSKRDREYLCQRNTGNKLKEIGLHFGIGESGVSQACRRVAQKIEKDKKLKKKIVRLEKQINLSRMKT